MVKEIHNCWEESELELGTRDREMAAMQKKIERYNVAQLGDLPQDREDGTMRILTCQMGGCAGTETREIKIAATERLIRKYDVNLCLFMELNFNWSKVNLSANLASWFQNEERDTRCVTAHNIEENDILFGKHQPGGTGMLCRHEYLQYARNTSTDSQGLSRWCSWLFYCNPTHVTRIVVAYQPCTGKTEGLKTVYQQHMRYIQTRGLNFNPINLFDQDLSKQVKEWRGRGEQIVLMMDLNDHPMRNKLYTKLKEHDMAEFTHKCWGHKEPYTHHSGKSPIDGEYNTPEVEIINLAMLNFAESPGDHRSLILDISIQSLLGMYRYKICRPVSR